MLVFAAKGCEEQLAYTSIEYEASSRGIYYHIHVEEAFGTQYSCCLRFRLTRTWLVKI